MRARFRGFIKPISGLSPANICEKDERNVRGHTETPLHTKNYAYSTRWRMCCVCGCFSVHARWIDFSVVGFSDGLFYRRQVVCIVRGGARAMHLNWICECVCVSLSKVVAACFFSSIWMCNYVFLCNDDGAPHTHAFRNGYTIKKESTLAPCAFGLMMCVSAVFITHARSSASATEYVQCPANLDRLR